MRLLNTLTRNLEEFFDDVVPKYTILSHTWGDSEVTFQDFKDGKVDGVAGHSKIDGCCELAASDGYEYVWIDTCCIDKTSSAELSEAINSMFRWYKYAQVCYAYLSDVPGGREAADVDPAFRRSRWFTRGWTLQELIAPEKVLFYDQQWGKIGTKYELQGLISSITEIEDIANLDINFASAAQKMSWASKRQTTRVEDEAYCLMGLFGVNMPPLYGEGNNSFLRLQREILNISNDESIFAWKVPGNSNMGMLAPSPAWFKDCGDIVPYVVDRERPPYSMTNSGLRMELLLIDHPSISRTYIAPLNCIRSKSRDMVQVTLLQTKSNTKFFRVEDDPFLSLNWSGMKAKLARRLVYVLNHQNSFLQPTQVAFYANLQLGQSGFVAYDGESALLEAPPDWDQIIGGRLVKLKNSFPSMYSGPRSTYNMLFIGHNSERFVLAFQTFRNGMGANIFILDDGPLRTAMAAFDRLQEAQPLFVQFSKHLRSGMSVTVKISKSPHVEDAYYRVMISIDRTGRTFSLMSIPLHVEKH